MKIYFLTLNKLIETKLRIFYYWIIRIYKNKNVKVSKEDFKRISMIKKEYPFVLTTKDTLEYLNKFNCSLARFGDGEFEFCFKKTLDHPYQKFDKQLSRRLLEILKSNSSNLLVCIPPFTSKYNNLKNWYGKLDYWQWYWLNNFEIIKSGFVKNKIYGNAFISREDVFRENSLEEIKRVWNNRKVVFVIGKGGRFDLESNLFDNIQEKEIIYAPAVQAFKDYENILSTCYTFPKEVLFILALGPTATVLAYDLSMSGYQALDLGHLPNCYSQFKGILVSPEVLPFEKKNK